MEVGIVVSFIDSFFTNEQVLTNLKGECELHVLEKYKPMLPSTVCPLFVERLSGGPDSLNGFLPLVRRARLPT